MTSSFPVRPWERPGMDLFEYQGNTFLIVVDYYSRWIKVKRLHGHTSEAVIKSLKEIFAVHGIPDLVISDNGPQLANETFRRFTEEYGFVHSISSPRYRQANGKAERGVRTVKSMLKKTNDIDLALLIYPSTPLQNGLAPCELLMGRRLRTLLPTIPQTLMPEVSVQDLENVREKEERLRLNQTKHYNQRHRARILPTLQQGDGVWIRDQARHVRVITETRKPRSYIIQTENGRVRRNRRVLVAIGSPDVIDPDKGPSIPLNDDKTNYPEARPNSPPPEEHSDVAHYPNNKQGYRTLSGRLVKQPIRLTM
nr:uncharacterized protein K02A2.6-like [Lytechinus pictus]